jgi:hypothetical protein
MSAQDGIVLPDLRIVELATIVPHEDFDERRIAALAERVQRDGKVRNPPIVAPIGDGRFVVLDGANRVSALKYLEYRDAIVQIVDYEAVELHSWHHLVVGYQEGDLVANLSALEGVSLRPCDAAFARAQLAAGEVLAFLTLPDDGRSSFTVHGGQSGIECAASLRALVQVYNGHADIHRVRSTTIEPLIGEFDDLNALVVFRTFSPAEVLEVVRADGKLPSGISRHVIPGRALRVNYPLPRLAELQPRDAKNAWLAKWIRQKMLAREIRYYQEPTILYDE